MLGFDIGFGIVWCGIISTRYGMVRCGIWCDVLWYGVQWNDMK